MSATVKFEYSAPVGLSCDPDAGRFALAGVHVCAADTGKVWITATNGRVLQAAKVTGEAETPLIVRGEKLKAGRKHEANSTLKVYAKPTRNNSAMNVAALEAEYPQGSIDGRFPNCAAVMPEVTAETHIAVKLDPLLLAQFKALVDDTDDACGITLYIPKPEAKVSSTVAVKGIKGIGCIMPLADAGRVTNWQETQVRHINEFLAAKAEYEKQFKAS